MSPAHDSARFRRDRRAFEPHERCAGVLAHPVDQRRDELLSCSGFGADKNSGVFRRDLLHVWQQLPTERRSI